MAKRTDEQNSNLDKLATYLENLPEDYDLFDMGWWLTIEWNYHEKAAQHEAYINYLTNNGGVHTCGTAACAAGHGPAAGILFREEEFDRGIPVWDAYCTRFVDDPEENNFIFGGGWAEADPHHYAAAARIRYILEHEEGGRSVTHWDAPSTYDTSIWIPLYRSFDKRYQNEGVRG